MPETRGVDAAVAEAVNRLRREILPYWNAFSPIVSVTFPAAATKRDVTHGLQQIPTGFHVVWADGPVYAEPGVLWTKELAYLRATNANTHARLIFFTCRGDARET